ncbi:MAG: CHAT domain-containing protein [Chlamydiales bacterium]
MMTSRSPSPIPSSRSNSVVVLSSALTSSGVFATFQGRKFRFVFIKNDDERIVSRIFLRAELNSEFEECRGEFKVKVHVHKSCIPLSRPCSLEKMIKYLTENRTVAHPVLCGSKVIFVEPDPLLPKTMQEIIRLKSANTLTGDPWAVYEEIRKSLSEHQEPSEDCLEPLPEDVAQTIETLLFKCESPEIIYWSFYWSYWVLFNYHYDKKDLESAAHQLELFEMMRSKLRDRPSYKNTEDPVEDPKFWLRAGGTFQQKDGNRAISYLEKIFHRNVSSQDINLEASLMLGSIFQVMHNYYKAAKYYKKAAKYAPNREIEDTIELNVKQLDLYQKMMRRVESFFPDSMGRTSTAAPINDHKEALSALGKIYDSILSDKISDAIDGCDAFLGIYENVELKLHVFHLKGICLLISHLPEKATSVFQDALEIAREQELSDQALSVQLSLQHGLGLSLLKSNKYVEAEKALRECIQIDQGLLSNMDITTGVKKIIIRRYQELSKVYRHLELALIKNDKSHKQEKALEISDLRRAPTLAKILEQKMQASPTSSDQASSTSSRSIPPFTIERMCQLSHKLCSTFVSYSLSVEVISIWVISPKEGIRYKEIDAKDFFSNLDKIEEFYKPIPSIKGVIVPKDGGASSSTNEFEASITPHPVQVFQTCVRMNYQDFWYDQLIRPIEEWLPQGETITIIPDGCLVKIPFATLYNPKKKKYLIEMHPVNIAPSLQVLHLLDLLNEERRAHQATSALVIGDPDTKNPKKGSLFWGYQEAVVVSKLLEGQSEDFLSKEGATVSNFMKKAPGARWIHTDCHGDQYIKNDNSLFRGQLNLSPDQSFTKGNLHSEMISKLSLKVELVFLNACHSGMGKLQQEWLIGPVWSFLSAGALSTIAAYWPVPDTSITKEMVRRFYQHIRGKDGFGKLNKAQALREAILLGMKQSNNVKQWGAFYLTGLIDMDSSCCTH